MGLTASFLPKPVVGVNGSGMHTNVSVSKEGKNLFWDPKGEEKLSKSVGLCRSCAHPRQRSVLADELQRERLSTARPALRGAQSVESFARGPWRDDPRANRQRAQHARGISRRRARRQSLSGDVLDLQDRAGRRNREDQEPALCRALPSGQHLHGHRKLRESRVDHENCSAATSKAAMPT